jgi:hypothetical protein
LALTCYHPWSLSRCPRSNLLRGLGSTESTPSQRPSDSSCAHCVNWRRAATAGPVRLLYRYGSFETNENGSPHSTYHFWVVDLPLLRTSPEHVLGGSRGGPEGSGRAGKGREGSEKVPKWCIQCQSSTVGRMAYFACTPSSFPKDLPAGKRSADGQSRYTSSPPLGKKVSSRKKSKGAAYHFAIPLTNTTQKQSKKGQIPV